MRFGGCPYDDADFILEVSLCFFNDAHCFALLGPVKLVPLDFLVLEIE